MVLSVSLSRREPRPPSPSRRTGRASGFTAAGAPALPPVPDGHGLCARPGRLWVSVPVAPSPGRAGGRGGQSLIPDEVRTCRVPSRLRFIAEVKGRGRAMAVVTAGGEAWDMGDEGESSVSRPGRGHRAPPRRASVSPPINGRSDRLGDLLLVALGCLCCPHEHTSCHLSFPCPESLHFPS